MICDDWKGEHLIRAPQPSDNERNRVRTLRNHAANGLSMAAAAKRMNMSMGTASRLSELYKITFLTRKVRI